MDSRVALITGGVRGIGRAVALALAARGWSVAACYRTSEQEAAELEAEILSRGGRVLLARADVSDPASAAGLVRRVESEYGRMDVLINCAGVFRRVHLLDESVEGWRSMFENNLHPVFYLSRSAAAGMMERKWGRIINFAMVNADRLAAQPYVTAHYIAKAGVLILTRSLAKILAPYGITVNAISPGFIDNGSLPPDELGQAVREIPAGYIGAPADAVSAVCYLLSEEARYVNGANIQISGAWGI